MCTTIILLWPCLTLLMIAVSMENLGLICFTVVIWGISFSVLKLEAENVLLSHFFLFKGLGSVAFLAIKMDNRGKNQLETWEQLRGRKRTYFWLWVMSVRTEVNMASLQQWYKVTRHRWDLRWLWARRLALWGKRTHTYTHIHTYHTIIMRSYHWGS